MRDWALSDEGRGQPPEQSPYLFRKYARARSSDGGIRGSGLGLAICKGLVEAPGGRIRAESGGTGLGTRFTFTIPVAEETGSRKVKIFSRPTSLYCAQVVTVTANRSQPWLSPNVFPLCV